MNEVNTVESVAKEWLNDTFQNSEMSWDEFMLDLKASFEKNDMTSDRLWNTLHWCDDSFSQQDLHREIIHIALHYNDPEVLKEVANDWIDAHYADMYSGESQEVFLSSLKASFEKNIEYVNDAFNDTRYWVTDTFSQEQLETTIIRIIMEQPPKENIEESIEKTKTSSNPRPR